MSRIGKLPIVIPADITVTQAGQKMTVKGKLGELSFMVHPNMQVKIEDNTIVVTRPNDDKLNRSLHGTTRSVLNNMLVGVSKGYKKTLEVRGVGYRFAVSGKKLNLSLGYSHPVEFQIPEGITVAVDEDNKGVMHITGCDKQLVGETAAQIRSFRKPEPYKGKGVRYIDERVTLKQGKKAAK